MTDAANPVSLVERVAKAILVARFGDERPLIEYDLEIATAALSAIPVPVEVQGLIRELTLGAEDPMWAHHCEMPKRIAKLAATALTQQATTIAALTASLEQARAAIKHQGGPLCMARYYPDGECTCGATAGLAALEVKP